jgi:ankyrin repeat protein
MRGRRWHGGGHVSDGILPSINDALWEAVGARDLPGVKTALRNGADVNMICSDGFVHEEMAAKKRGVGRSLLHHAAWAGDLEIFRYLVEQGADVARKRNTAWRPNGGVRGRGATPLHHACMYGRTEVVRFLLDEAGAEVNEPGEQGYTALHLAVKFNYPELVELLLMRGARTDMMTRDEKTARDLAGGQQERSHEQSKVASPKSTHRSIH